MRIPYVRESLVGFALVLLACGAAFGQNWNTITDNDNGFTIKFPELPQEVYKNTPQGLKTTTYAQSAACTYMVKIFVMNSEPKDGHAMATETVNSMAAKLGGEVTENKEWKHGDAIGIKGTINVPDKGEGKPQLKVLCHVIVIGQVEYQLVAMGPLDLFEDAVAEHFLGTFRFL